MTVVSVVQSRRGVCVNTRSLTCSVFLQSPNPVLTGPSLFPVVDNQIEKLSGWVGPFLSWTLQLCTPPGYLCDHGHNEALSLPTQFITTLPKSTIIYSFSVCASSANTLNDSLKLGLCQYAVYSHIYMLFLNILK